jgi:hypothetical protein
MTIDNKELEYVEIYPYILAYKNTFKNINETFAVLSQSAEGKEDRVLGQWSNWSIFGEYIEPLGSFFDNGAYDKGISRIKPETLVQKKQKEFLEELLSNFYSVTDHYCKKYNIDIDKESKLIDVDGMETKEWYVAGPSIARYFKNYYQEWAENPIAMYYHSDFIREPMDSAGYKFAITALVYFNDDYEGGEIEFAVGKKLIRYKPQAGDFLVFPSGHPDYLTEDGNVYIHAVLPLGEGNNKYLSRMYWQKYSKGSEEWHAGLQKYGKEEWSKIYKKMFEDYSKENPQRSHIEGGVRVV